MIKLQIIQENSFWLVIDKPSGMSVHNEGKEPSVLEQMAQQQKGKKLYPVHRLDAMTSGCLLLAKDVEAAAELSAEFQDHAIEKTYCALLCGKLLTPASTFRWEKPITDKAEGRKNPSGEKAHRKEALTIGKVIAQNQYFTKVLIDLKTGRQHQIRKHAAMEGHALFGDERYGNPAYNQKLFELYKINRLGLHCLSMAFKFRGKEYLVESLWPKELEKIL